MNRQAAVVAAAVLLLGGSAPAADVVEETFEESYPIDADGTVSIHDTDGSIRIYAADVSDVSLHAVKKAYTAERLNALKIEVKATRKSLVIETQFPPKQTGWSLGDRSGTVEYTLIVPLVTKIASCDLVNGEVLIEGLQGGSAKAHLVNGWLAGHNSFADLDLSMVNGKLDVAYDWWQSEKTFTVNARSVNGGIHASIPPDGSAEIAAESQNGKVSNTLNDNAKPDTGTHSIELAVGEGESAEITLRTNNGNVRIDKSYESDSTQ